MPRNRFGKRRIPKDLEVNKGITIKKINLDIGDMGYQMRFNGYEPEADFPTYIIIPIRRCAVPLNNNIWKVYALGDYTVEQWRTQISGRLRKQSPADADRAIRRAIDNRRRRLQREKASK